VLECDINMGRIGNKQHEKVLRETIEKLEKDGYHVVNLKGKSPDAIATKDNKLIAVEVLGETYRKGKWKKSWTYTQKEDDYSMFDDILIRTFKRNKPTYEKGEGMISTGTQNYIHKVKND